MTNSNVSGLIPSKDDVIKAIVIDLVVVVKTKIALSNGTYSNTEEKEWIKELNKMSLSEIESGLIANGIIDSSLESLQDRLRSTIKFMNRASSIQ